LVIWHSKGEQGDAIFKEWQGRGGCRPQAEVMRGVASQSQSAGTAYASILGLFSGHFCEDSGQSPERQPELEAFLSYANMENRRKSRNLKHLHLKIDA
jgi:hypothetical protein